MVHRSPNKTDNSAGTLADDLVDRLIRELYMVNYWSSNFFSAKYGHELTNTTISWLKIVSIKGTHMSNEMHRASLSCGFPGIQANVCT